MMLKFCTALIIASITVNAQEHTEKILKEFSYEKKADHNALMIANIYGGITVEAYDGDKIQIEVTKTVRAKTSQRLEAGKREIHLGVVDLADTIILYITNPCHRFKKIFRNRGDLSMGTKWGYSTGENKRDACHETYSYRMDFLVKIPAASNLLVSTINDGDISVSNSNGVVKANNINGSIKLENLTKEAEAHTINGDLNVEYFENPKNACRFYSLNGDINALFKKGLAASISFESFNGDFYTNIDHLEKLPVQVVKNKEEHETRYKVGNNRYKVGLGGAYLDFETFNGNVYLKEQ
jgi:hypothetical protein